MAHIVGTSSRVITSAEEYFRSAYPGHELVDFQQDIQRKILRLELRPIDCPVCPVCGQRCKVHSKIVRTVRCAPRDAYSRVEITLPIRRVRCEHCGSRATEAILWLQTRSRLSNKLIAYAQFLLRAGSTITEVANSLHLHWETVKRIDKEQLKYALETMNLSGIRHLIIDEFAIHKGHKYATSIMDADTHRIIEVIKGKTGNDLRPFFQMLKDKHLDRKIESVAMDMNAVFPSLVHEYLPKATVLYDGFHVLQMFTRDVLAKAKIRAQEDALERFKENPEELRKQNRLFKGCQWIIVRDALKLEANEQERLEELRRNNQLLADLYPLVELIRNIWACKDKGEAAHLLKQLHSLGLAIARVHNFTPIRSFVQTLKRRMDGIIQVGRFGYSSCPLEGAHNKIKVLKRKAYGFRDFEYFRLKILSLFPGTRRDLFWDLNFSTAVYNNRVYQCCFHANP